MTSAIETTQVLGTDHTDGLHLVYLPKYCDPDAPEQSEDDESIYRRFTDYLGPALARLQPRRGRRLDRAAGEAGRAGAPAARPDHGVRVAPIWPGVEGLALASNAQIYPYLLNGDSVMGFAEAVARRGRRAARRWRAAVGRKCEKRTSRLVASLRASAVAGLRLRAMYQVEASKALLKPRLWARRSARLRVPRNVVMLGMVSLLTDVSSEMVATVLPLYLVFTLGASPLVLGAIDGTYRGAAALVQVASGFVSDRWRRHKEVAGAGYGLSALGKVALVAAGNTIGGIGAIVAVDRVGKGIRTAPRDALISLSSTQGRPRHLLRRAPGDGQRRRDAGPAGRLRHPARSPRPASTPSSSSAPSSPCSASPSWSSPCRASRSGRRARAARTLAAGRRRPGHGPALRAAAARRRPGSRWPASPTR